MATHLQVLGLQRDTPAQRLVIFVDLSTSAPVGLAMLVRGHPVQDRDTQTQNTTWSLTLFRAVVKTAAPPST